MSLAVALALVAAAPAHPLLGSLEARAREASRRLDEAVNARRAAAKRLTEAQAPAMGLMATIQRLALRPPLLAIADPAGTADLAKARAMLAAMAPEIAARQAALQRASAGTRALRAGAAAALEALDSERARRQAATDGYGLRLAAVGGPRARPGAVAAPAPAAYRLAATGRVLGGTRELLEGGARTRGLALATAAGARVTAPASGWIAYAGPFRGYGTILILDHGHGWTTLLAGLEGVAAQRGQLVRAGQPIGWMAQAGPRLTIELRHDGRVIDVAGMAAMGR